MCGACGNVDPLLQTEGHELSLLGTLQTRIHTIDVYAGPLYTVYAGDGTRLAHLVPDWQLEGKLSDLPEGIDRMLAEPMLSGGTWERRHLAAHQESGMWLRP